MFDALTIGEKRAEPHKLVRLRFRIMRRLDEVDRSAQLVEMAAADLIEAAQESADTAEQTLGL